MICRNKISPLFRHSRRFLQTSHSSVPLSNPAIFGSLPSSTATTTKSWTSHNLEEHGGLSRTAKPVSLVFGKEESKVEQRQSLNTGSESAVDTRTQASTSKPKRKLRPRKAAIRLSETAVKHLKALLDSPDPKLIRIGVRNRGCSGLTYHLEYVDQPGKFDEQVIQDGVKVLIDSKALFSIIGSEMDWVDDKLASRFVFNNPNSKGACGCGESFMV